MHGVIETAHCFLTVFSFCEMVSSKYRHHDSFVSTSSIKKKTAYSLTVAQGHAHVDFFLVVKDFPQLDDVRVVQSLKNAHLFPFRVNGGSS